MPPAEPVVVPAVGESRYRKTQRPAAWKDQDLEEDSAYVSNGNSNDYVETGSSPDADYDLESRDYRWI